MITSMTGFGLSKRNNKDFSIEVHFRSVNSRFFDLNIKLPHIISILEKEIHALSKEKCKRGTIQVYCRLKMKNDKMSITKLNQDKLDSFYKMLLPINQKLTETNFNLNLSFDNILSKLTDDDELYQLSPKHRKYILSTFDLALKDLLKSRIVEGKKIEKEIKFNIKKLNKINLKIIRLEDKNKKQHFENYINRIKLILNDFDFDLNDNRLYKELSFFSDKYDISEETSRITYHLNKFNSYIDNEDYPGKKINFLCQELFREINTIGSKASNEIISTLVIDFKTNLEKIREQVQNIL